MAANRVAVFLDQLRESQTLDKAVLEETSRHSLARGDDPMPLARDMLARGLLTSYQVNVLLQGKARDLVVGPYLVLDRLGEGGMGFVYKARHQTMNRLVALKVIRRERVANAHNVKRFLQEVRAVSQLSHPNIVTAFDTGQAGDLHYYAMEFVEGTDLSKLVKSSGPLKVEQACEYIRQAAKGLAHAHEQGLIHRDIKPGNLMLSKSGQIKILDMGLARLDSADGSAGLTKVGTVVGTPEYLAPEQAKDSHNIDPRADLYSLGCTLYFLLTGQPPFKSSSLPELLFKHQTEEPAPLEKFRPEIPPQLWLVVKKLLAKKPEDRYARTSDLILALSPFIHKSTMMRTEDAPAPSKPSRASHGRGSSPRLGKPRRKKRGSMVPVVFGLGSVIVAVAAGAYLATHLGESFAPADVHPSHVASVTPTKAETADTRPQPETNTETKPEVKPDTKPDTKPEVKPDTKPATKPPETKPESKPPDTKPMTKPPDTKPAKPPEPPKPGPGGKYRVPPPAELLDAQKTVRDAYKDDYARTKPPERIALANKLLANAAKIKDDPVLLYILLYEAGDQASFGGDLDLVLRAIDEIDQKFIIDALDMKIGVLDKASRSEVLPQMKTIALRSMALAEETIDRSNFDAARRLLTSAETAARKAKDQPLVARIQTRSKEVGELSGEYESARTALETLLQKPNDAEANYKLGRFLCFFKGNWEEGLLCLAKGSDAKLRVLAGKEVTRPTSSIAQRELGDDWWDLAEKNTGLARKHLLLHVKYWYELCVGQLPTGLERTRVERRLREIPTLVSADALEKPPEKKPDKTSLLPPDSYERQLAAGQNYLKLGFFPKAIEAFNGALKAKPGDSEAMKGLADARYAIHMINGQNAAGKKDYTRAVDEFNAALTERPGDLAAQTAVQQAKAKLPK